MTKFYFTGFLLGSLALLIRLVFGVFPETAEWLYGDLIYPPIRHFFDDTIGQVPFTMGWLPIIVALLILFQGIRKLWRGKALWRFTILKTLGIAGYGLFWFLFVWGFNYARPDVESRLKWEVEELTSGQWEDLYVGSMEDAMDARRITEAGDGSPVTEWALPPGCKQDVLMQVRSICARLGYLGETSVPVRKAFPDGLLRRMGIAGIYNPFTGEPHIDGSFTALPTLFTSAHEMAHACGVTDEGDANFIAWMACRTSNCKLANYAAEYVLWRELAKGIPENYPDSALDALVERIPKPLLADREALRNERKKYRAVAPRLAERVNDSYLKAQGVDEGVASYNRLAVLALAWKKENEKNYSE